MSSLKAIEVSFESVNSCISQDSTISASQFAQQEAICSENTSNNAGKRRLRTETINSPLIKAAPNELIDILVKYGNNPDGIPPLHYAIKCQDEKAINLLLEHGADPNARSLEWPIGEPVTTIDFAAAYGTPEIIKTLINSGAQINVMPGNHHDHVLNRPSPLHFAVRENKIENIRVLIESGADKQYIGGCGLLKSSINLAAFLENVEALKILVQSETDANFCSPGEEPGAPLISAMGNIDAVRFLLEAGANPNLRPQTDFVLNGEHVILPNVPFILSMIGACGAKDGFKIFSLLLDYGLDIDMQDDNGNTLLMNLVYRYEYICSAGYADINFQQDCKLNGILCIEAILKKGADIQVKSRQGRTASSCAKSKEIIALLQKYGNKVV